MDVDRQRIAAVRALEGLGYVYRGGEWLAPAGAAVTPLSLMAKADAMHGALMRRADALAGGARKGRTKGPSSRQSSMRSRPTRPSDGRWARSRTCQEERGNLALHRGPRKDAAVAAGKM
jgi:hypothetical protein